MAKKTGRIIVTLECTEARAEGKPVSRYTTTKNKTKIFLHETWEMLKRHWLLCIYAVLLMTGACHSQLGVIASRSVQRDQRCRA